NPNVGKSTLMNALVGEKLSIITKKCQTTRHRILGLVNGEDFQIVFSDTPGILNPHYKLQQCMLQQVEGALSDADVFLVVTDMGEEIKNKEIYENIKRSNIPVVVVINKIDLASQEKVNEIIEHWQKEIPRADIVPCSALHSMGIEKVMDLVKGYLPASPAYYDKDMLTDKSMRFLVSEIIREKILLIYDKEIPYSTEVAVEEFKESEQINRIRAVIFTERDSQKKILIGRNGSMIKKVGTEARKDIEEFTEKKCFLELMVKVKKDWRNCERDLRNFGYESKR
ncbi:MAG: GTPase Era, partial [Bacteroidales bacterium]|nr:GTPase Era [Bacteroidales bacterium]